MNEVTKIWEWYEKGVDHHRKNNLYSDTDTFYNMIEGEQWRGIESGDEKLPFHDFISGIVDHKTAMVALNDVTLNYSPLNSGPDQAIYRRACELLNEHAATKWELLKMDTLDWDVVRAACITGDSYLFFYNHQLDCQLIDRTNIYLADEQEPDIQKQKRVIIYERRFVEDVRKEAAENGIEEQEISLIMSDEDTENLPEAAKDEVKTDSKCSCLLCIEKKDDGIYVSRATKTVVYQPEEKIEGLKRIPIAKMIWGPKRGSARGIGEVKRQLNNQINSNKLLVRRQESIKMSAFPKPVMNVEMVSNPEDASRVGVAIKIKGAMKSVRDAFGYVAPQTATHEPKELQEEFIEKSRNLSNAGDNATGNINPERASGAAIIAVRDQQAIATTKQQQYHKQFVEDVALIWLDTWIAYNPNGISIDTVDENGEPTQDFIDAAILEDMEAMVRIDVSPSNPYSKFAREQALENALAAQHITFNEYVDALDDDGSAPKGKFRDILDAREEQENLMAKLEEAISIIEQQSQYIGMLEGGTQNAMPILQDQGIDG